MIIQWQFKPVDEEDGYHIILMDGANHEPWVWSSIGDVPQPNTPLMLSMDEDRKIVWKIEPFDNGVEDAYV